MMKIPWEEMENASDKKEASYVFILAMLADSVVEKECLKNDVKPTENMLREKMTSLDLMFRYKFAKFVGKAYVMADDADLNIARIDYPSKKMGAREFNMLHKRIIVRLGWPFMEQPKQVSKEESRLIQLWSADQPDTEEACATKGLSRAQAAWVFSRSIATIQKHA